MNTQPCTQTANFQAFQPQYPAAKFGSQPICVFGTSRMAYANLDGFMIRNTCGYQSCELRDSVASTEEPAAQTNIAISLDANYWSYP